MSPISGRQCKFPRRWAWILGLLTSLQAPPPPLMPPCQACPCPHSHTLETYTLNLPTTHQENRPAESRNTFDCMQTLSPFRPIHQRSSQLSCCNCVCRVTLQCHGSLTALVTQPSHRILPDRLAAESQGWRLQGWGGGC